MGTLIILHPSLPRFLKLIHIYHHSPSLLRGSVSVLHLFSQSPSCIQISHCLTFYYIQTEQAYPLKPSIMLGIQGRAEGGGLGVRGVPASKVRGLRGQVWWFFYELVAFWLCLFGMQVLKLCINITEKKIGLIMVLYRNLILDST